MPELMKNQYYNYNSIHELALKIKAVFPSFEVDNFVSDVMDKAWDNLELKARMRQITLNMGKYLPADYEKALGIIDKVVAKFPVGLNENSYIYFPDFVEVYGQAQCNWHLSIAALERYTQSSTAEFAVRQFIVKHEPCMMRQMAIWARHKNEHVRRLASEGCRPALPWGQALLRFKQDPSPVLEILELLKADPSLYVRKSVANNLNDISKTHPDLIAKIATDWYGNNKYTNWIVKHGCRTLLKKGNRHVLDIFGFEDASCVNIDNFTLNTAAVCIAEAIAFSFAVSSNKTIKLRLEYSIDYVKANAKHSTKIFQISELLLKEKQVIKYTKTHSFANLSTRLHYAGIHCITLIVNGEKRAMCNFEVLPAK